MSLRGLGYAALLLSLVSPDRILALVGVGSFIDAPVALGGLVGGIALMAGRRWGRWLLVAASALGIVTFFLPGTYIPRYGPSPIAWIVVHASIGGAALYVGRGGVVVGPWRSLARVSYAFLGAVALWVAYVVYLFFRPPSSDQSSNAAGLGFFVAIPFGIAGAIALVVAAIQTLIGWRDILLVVLLALTVGFGVYLGRWWNYEWVPWCAYGLVSLGLALAPARFLGRPVAV